ncbi:MAG: glutathione S-transferase family protein [Pseudomonadales bacterium]|nr:glutathione S-transferase family protein [Pseudomonadales bacterium]
MTRYRLYGGGGSPYSQKMRGILHYRRLPFDWVQITPAIRAQIKHDGPPVIPILQLPEDGSLHVDSTPLALMLEDRHSQRSIIPDDPAMAFLSYLIEDMADEWVTKMMFHYRWDLEIDQQYSARQIISDNTPGLRGEALAQAAEAIRQRQVGRMPLVGCTPQNKPIIEQGFHELLAILDTFATRDEYLFGTRPSLADFGLFGQLKTLASDHTPMLIMRSTVPSVYDWVRRLEDSSGIDGQWHSFDDMRGAVGDLLRFTGRYYLPFLQANASAAEAGNDELRVELAGCTFQQPTFKYQVKCFQRLRSLLQTAPGSGLRELLRETGCLDYLE